MSKLKWRDSEDAYQPVNLPLQNFLQEKEIFFELNTRHFDQIPSNKPMNIFIVEEAEKELKKHLSLDPNNETGGVLVGNAYFCSERNSYYTEILGSIPAPYTVGNRVHFKFTPECWQEILRIQKQDFSGTTIVGWYHSHPGHGIFLSGTDLNTQRLSFKQVWQVATVYDPIKNKIGYFYGRNGERLENKYLIYLTKKSSESSKEGTLKSRITQKPEQSDDSDTAIIVEQDVRNEDQRVISPDDVEEQVLSDFDNFVQNVGNVVKVTVRFFKGKP